MRYLLAPYEPGTRPRSRRVALVPALPDQDGPPPWEECEAPGDLALCWTEDAALAQQAAKVPGVLLLPDVDPLTNRLRDLSAAERADLSSALDAMGIATRRPALTARMAEWMLRAVESRRATRWDEALGKIVLDGDVQAQARPLPWQAAGGAFPTQGVLDAFTGLTNNTSPPNANWSNNADNGTSGLSANGSDAIKGGGTLATGWWNAATFGPDCEAYITHTTTTGSNGVGVFARLATPGTAGVDGYMVYHFDGSPDVLQVYRITNAAYTQLGANISQTITNGDKVGIEVVSSTITVYYFTSSAWSSKGTRTDATYSAAGYIGAEVDGASRVADDFGGGTVGATAATSNVPVRPMRRFVPMLVR